MKKTKMFSKCRWKTKMFSQLKNLKFFSQSFFLKLKICYLCLKKLLTLFFFSCVLFEVFESAVFIFSSQNCFDLAIFHFFDFEFESVCNNNSFIYVFEICVSFFFSMVFFSVDNVFDFFELVNSVVNSKNNFSAYKKKSIEDFLSDDSNASITSRIRERDLINRKLTNFFQNFSYFDIQNVFSFNEKNVSNFLKTYDEICKAHSIIDKNKIRRLHQYCTSVINQYVKIIFVENNLNWKKIRKILRQKFKAIDIFQKLIIFNYLKTLKNTPRTKLNEVSRYIRKYVAAFNQFFEKRKIQMRFQSKWFLQKLSKDFALDFAKKINYDNDDDEMIFYSKLKKTIWKFSKNFKTFNEIRNLSKISSKMNKLIRNIENSNILKKIQIKNEEIIVEASSMNNCIDNMIRVMKKMILNVNTFMQKIVNRIQYSALSFSIQIMKRFETKTFVAIFQIQTVSSM